jgi:hypothetical protein
VQHSPPPAVQPWDTSEQACGTAHTPPRHCSPPATLQHGTVAEQVWPVSAQVGPDVLHRPLVAPGGISQESPAQQSPSMVQAPSLSTHRFAQAPPAHLPVQHSASAAQVLPSGSHCGSCSAQLPSMHMPEQHSDGCVQSPPTLHPGSGIPETQYQPANGCAICWQLLPSQHAASPAPVQVAPSGLQAETEAHLRTKLSSGTQGARPQHWSRNWQTSPSAMQHSGFDPS